MARQKGSFIKIAALVAGRAEIVGYLFPLPCLAARCFSASFCQLGTFWPTFQARIVKCGHLLKFIGFNFCSGLQVAHVLPQMLRMRNGIRRPNFLLRKRWTHFVQRRLHQVGVIIPLLLYTLLRFDALPQ